MNKHTVFIRSVLVVFGLLLLTRIPAFLEGNLDPVTAVSTVVEGAFLIWGLVVLKK
jgi:hypothetical protein